MVATAHYYRSKEQCKVCSSSFCKQKKVADMFSNSNFVEETTVKTCFECGFSEVLGVVHMDRLLKFYEREYVAKRRKITKIIADFLGIFRLDVRGFAQMVLIKRYLDGKSVKNFMDFGGGAGNTFFLANLVLRSHNNLLVDPKKVSGRAFFFKKLFRKYDCIEEVIRWEARQDVIILSHSLEHLPASYALDVLIDLKRVIRPDGVLLIEVPNDDFRNEDIDIDIDAPHFMFFTEKSLVKFLETSGWSVQHVSRCGENSFICKPYYYFYPWMKLFIGRVVRYFEKSHPEFNYNRNGVCLRVIAVPKIERTDG